MLPKFDQLTQSIHDDGKGGYIIKDLPKIKEPVIDEQPQATEPVIMRGEEVSLIKAVKDMMEENVMLKERLAKVEAVPIVKSTLDVTPIIKEPIISEPIIKK